MNASSYADRVFLALIKNRELNQHALRALRKATHLLGLAAGMRLAELRESDEPLQRCFSQTEENALHANLFHEAATILSARWQKIPRRRRPQYSSEQRFRILRIKDLLALSIDETANLFCLCPNTISRWQTAALTHPNRKALGPNIQPKPPIRRYADVVRHLVQTMALLGFGGNKLIAQTLARAGWKLSTETVRRIRKESTPPAITLPAKSASNRSVKAHYPGHIWMADLTDVTGLFGLLRFKIALVLDVFSRMPLAFRVFTKEPNAQEIRSLFRQATARFGSPKHFVSDQGPQFIDSGFRRFLRGLRIKQRFGAIGKTGSIAVIERFWKTLKNTLSLRFFRPLLPQDLERRLQVGLFHYAYIRPHQGLDGATPAEVFFGIKPARLSADHPPRGRPGEGPSVMPFDIEFIDSERMLPVLVSIAA
jgi:transposase InsO family protein